MRAYRAVWLYFAGVLALLGCAVSLVAAPISGLLSVAIVGVLLEALVYELIAGQEDHQRRSRQEWMRSSLGAVACCWALVGLGAAMGPSGVWTGLVTLAVSPPVLAWYGRRLPADQGWRPAQTAGSGARPVRARLLGPSGLGQMTTGELCLAWRCSFITLREAGLDDDRVVLVQARAYFLDELERRNPAGFSRWIASGARAAGDPEPFLLPVPGGSADVGGAR